MKSTSQAFFLVLLVGSAVLACSSSGGPSGGEGTDGGSSPAPSGSGSSGAPNGDAGPTTTPNGGCHLSCKCYEPPYHPDEIDCHGACTKLAGWTSDSVCAYFAGSEGVADCERRCAGIRETWDKPNLATYIASEIFGCATLSSSCDATKACSQAITDQQKTVCP